jgi:signal transduction histidine kinase
MQKASLNEEETFEATSYILADSERLQKVSEKLLDAAFIRNNEIKYETVDLAKLTEDTVCRLTGKATKRKVVLQADVSPATVWGDGVLLDVLLSNLTDNAIKACAEGGAVTITCLTEKDSAVIAVTDNGRGITEEQLLHITEPFYRTDKSRSRADGGAGLGLALCQRIADAHGVSMTFTSALGKGTTVRLIFTTS